MTMELNIIRLTVFLINFIYLTKGDVIKHSLTFVIDVTRSMNDEIRAVKEKTNQVFEAVLKSRSSQIGDFVLVTFNDPDTPKTRAKTTNREVFKSALADIKVQGGKDCPELSMGGILKALEESAPNSELYVFTDATAKDYERYGEVKTMSQRKSSQVTFLLTGTCSTGINDKPYLVYHDLAEVTGGEVFHIHKQNVNKILNYIIEKSKSARTVLVKKELNGNDQFQINVDSNMGNVIVSAAGGFTEMSIFNSDGNEVVTELLVDEDLVHIVQFATKPGLYTVKVKTNENTSLQVSASTNISFEHGFSQSRPRSISETSTMPIMGQKSYLSILLTDTAKDVTLVESQLRNVNGDVVMTIPLERISFRGDQQFYISEPVNIPKYTTKVAIIGYTSRKEHIMRVGPVFVEPQSKDPNITDFEYKPPKASVTTGNQVKVESNMPFALKCKVEAYPNPHIIWENEFGNKFSPEVKILDFPYDYISILEVEKAAKNETYYCKTQNTFGTDRKQVNVIISSVYPQPVEPITTTVIREEEMTNIKCDIPHQPTDYLRWYKDGEEFYSGELRLDNPQPESDGIYTCRVSNYNSSRNYHTRVKVHYKPRFINEKSNEPIDFVEGFSATLDCGAVGNPIPNIMWTLNGNKIDVRSLTYRIEHMLNNDIGKYECHVFNDYGNTNRTFQIKVTACLIPLEYFNNKQPSMLTPSLTWATYKIIKGSRNESFISVPAEGSFVLYCPDNLFTNPALNRRKNIKAKCIRDSLLEVDGKTIDFLDLKCYKRIKPFIKSTKRKCGTSVNTELIIVGYILGRGFLKVYEVCIEKDNMIPLYTQHDLNEFMSNYKEEPKYLDAKEFPVDFDQMYSQQANTLLGRFIKTNDSCKFSKRQLVSPRDVYPGSQIVTYNYLNVVPHWSCYNQNWERMENTIRSLAQQIKLTVWTGTSNVISSPDPYGIEIDFRDSSDKELVAPLYLWKVVQNLELAGSVAIIQVNVPNITPSEVHQYVKCRDICNEIDWLRSDDWHVVRKGYTYCCSINEFENAFDYTGVLSGPRNILKVPILDFISNQLP